MWRQNSMPGLSTPHVFKYWELIGKGWKMTSCRTVYDVICAKNTRGIIYHTKIYEEMFDVNSKIAQTTQNILKFIVGKSSLQLNYKLRRISGRFHSLIWRPGDTVQNLESSGLSRRVGGTGMQLYNSTHKHWNAKSNVPRNFKVICWFCTAHLILRITRWPPWKRASEVTLLKWS